MRIAFILLSLGVLSISACAQGLDVETGLAVPGMIESSTADAVNFADGDPSNVASEALALSDVIASLYRSYPEVLRARQEPQRTRGQLVSAYGAYDTKLQAQSLSESLGFYRNYRHGIGVARQTWWGGYVSAGYRIGRGSFQPWYKEGETNEGGELKVGAAQPLLQGRAIDPQRLAVFQASIETRAAEPRVLQAILDTSLDAAIAYWDWVTAGAVWDAQRDLLMLAETRGEQFKTGVEAGKFPEIDLILNQQLIAERRGKVIESEQKFRESGFKLGLFLRDDASQPMLAQDDWLPQEFPKVALPSPSEFQADLAAAIARRPETRLFELQIRQVELDRRLAFNDRLPRLDLVAEASQDMGAAATSARDKGEFQLLLGVQSEVPIQRRKATGKMQSAAAKIAQLREKLRLQQDKIATDLQIGRNAIQLRAKVVEQAEQSLSAARESLERYRFAFEKGKVDLIYLNLLETKANETEIKLIEAQRDWFDTLAELQFTLGLDPLQQAMLLDEVPAEDAGNQQ